MGIRFYCPACEKKINVKEHQAGLRGICPQCGIGVDIPLVSEPRRDRNSPRGTAPATGPSLAPGAAGEQTISTLLPQVGRLLAVSANPPVDPIAELPDGQWYVVPQGGTEPFGPADGMLLRRWMQEGRVGARSMVWRQDWPDWRKAGTIWSDLVLAEAEAAPTAKLQRMAAAAPQFGAPAVPSMPPQAAPTPTPVMPTATTPTKAPAAAGFDKPGGELYYPRRSNGLYLTMVVLLVVAVIGLGFVTLRVLDRVRQKQPAAPNENLPDEAVPAATSHRYPTKRVELNRYETATT